MPYVYSELRAGLFTEDGQVMLLKMRDFVKETLPKSGAVRMDKLMSAAGTGDSWTMLACADRLVELGDLREITNREVAGQHRVFVSGRGE